MRQEQLQKHHVRHKAELPVGTFPEATVRVSGGNGPDGTDELLERIDEQLRESTLRGESTTRALGAASGVETD
mgnify:CR=1 FL=1